MLADVYPIDEERDQLKVGHNPCMHACMQLNQHVPIDSLQLWLLTSFMSTVLH
jgi:hypothetical protein